MSALTPGRQLERQLSRCSRGRVGHAGCSCPTGRPEARGQPVWPSRGLHRSWRASLDRRGVGQAARGYPRVV